MSRLNGKKIVLGISGGIAAYKSAELTRLLVKVGASIRVVMTRGGLEFITPLTLQTLSGNPVHTDLFSPAEEAAMGHIDLARWADLIVIAPASANTLARLAQGRADDLLSTLCLASSAPLIMAPAMNQQMWANTATKENIHLLQSRGHTFIGPASGAQACGDTGPGRMEEPELILQGLETIVSCGPLSGKQVLVTAGPTREPIDPVRYISNNSSGKMGYAMARAAYQAGADVTLVSGPVTLGAPAGIETIRVETAEQMLNAVMQYSTTSDIFIATAAVSDYRVKHPLSEKHKKAEGALELELEKNPDILATVAAQPKPPFCVGFAAETRNLEQYARDKLNGKQLDMIAANLVGDGLAFDRHENALEVFSRDGSHHSLPMQDKQTLARQLIALIAEHAVQPNNIIDLEKHA
jgi:phosphopantothenoylcysteine decarboxylase/phosphopantothenate--cysteine ligase